MPVKGIFTRIVTKINPKDASPFADSYKDERPPGEADGDNSQAARQEQPAVGDPK